ncbi:MAG: hypothetical protein OEM46_03165 [Ignavibacteria bacterium]|nr:hypothetical protein [Ignavibacteria bacterium]
MRRNKKKNENYFFNSNVTVTFALMDILPSAIVSEIWSESAGMFWTTFWLITFDLP